MYSFGSVVNNVGSLMASVAMEGRSTATHLNGALGEVVSVITYIAVVSAPVPTVVLMAMCGGLFGRSDLFQPSNSLMLRPSWVATTRAPFVASCELPPPIETKPSHLSSIYIL